MQSPCPFELTFITGLPGRRQALVEALARLPPDKLETSGISGLWEIDVGLLNTVAVLRGSVETKTDYVDRSFVGRIRTFHLSPAPFSPTMDTLQGYLLYEIRRYRYWSDALPGVLARWSASVDRRIALSPLVAFGYTEARRVTDIFHIWPYHDMQERAAVREQALRGGFWPPGALDGLISQQNCFAQPLPNSAFC